MAKSKKTTRTGAGRKAPATRKAAAKTARKAKAPAAAATQPRTVTAYLAVNDAASAIGWYKKVFGAKETSRQEAPGNKIMHAALRIGDSEVYLSDIFPGSDVQDPARAGASVTLHVWSKNIDKLWQTALANGAKVTMPIDNMFWGDRYGRFVDPYGHAWALNYKAKMTKEEMARKQAEAMARFGAGPA